MKNINLKAALYLILAISTAAFLILMRTREVLHTDLLAVVKLLPKVVSIDLLLIGLFAKYLWKLRIFRGWLVPFPDLNGTWKGSIQTTWIDPTTSERPAAIPAMLTIRQTFFKISCVMRTAEMTSRSLSADFFLDKENQIRRLIYVYDSNPIANVRERSPQHMGTMTLDLPSGIVNEMHGEYWTGRKTTGEIQMDFWKKQRLDRYPEELGTHPVSQARGNNS